MWKTDKKILRVFGCILGLVIALIFGLLIPWVSELAWPLWPWIASMVTVVFSVFWPKLLLPVFVLLSVVSGMIGKVVNFLVLSSVFIVLITPIALLFKLKNRDILQRKFDSELSSYLTRTSTRDPNHMEKPY